MYFGYNDTRLSQIILVLELLTTYEDDAIENKVETSLVTVGVLVKWMLKYEKYFHYNPTTSFYDYLLAHFDADPNRIDNFHIRRY
jgi:hypothetical protein